MIQNENLIKILLFYFILLYFLQIILYLSNVNISKNKLIYKDNFLNTSNYKSNKTITICCLCRNISNIFSKSKIKLETIGKIFKSYQIVLFENDSSDNSRKLLKKWTQENKNVILLNCNVKDCKLNNYIFLQTANNLP